MASSTIQPPVPNQNPPATDPSAQHHLQPKKRALELAQSSPYSKMRAVLRDSRPLFLEALRAQDFRSSAASTEIQKKMKLMVDLCKQMAGETPAIAKCNNGTGSQDGPTVKKAGEEAKDPPTEKKTSENPSRKENTSEEVGKRPVSYVVGKSAFGWNFITFGGSKPVYYGRTKESFRAGV